MSNCEPTPEHLIIDLGGEWSVNDKDHRALIKASAEQWGRDKKEIERLRAELKAAKIFAGLLMISGEEGYAYAVKHGYKNPEPDGEMEVAFKQREILAPKGGSAMDEMRAMAKKAVDEYLEADDE